MEEALVARLVAAATGAADRVSWFGRARGDALPGIVLEAISPGEDWTHDGPDRLAEPRVRIRCLAETDTAAVALAREVKVVMQVEASVSGIRFHPAQLDAWRTLDQSEEDGGAPLFELQSEYLFFYEEA